MSVATSKTAHLCCFRSFGPLGLFTHPLTSVSVHSMFTILSSVLKILALLTLRRCLCLPLHWKDHHPLSNFTFPLFHHLYIQRLIFYVRGTWTYITFQRGNSPVGKFHTIISLLSYTFNLPFSVLLWSVNACLSLSN